MTPRSAFKRILKSDEVVYICVSPSWVGPVRTDEGIKWKFQAKGGINIKMIDYSTGEVFESFQVRCGKCLDCLQLHKIEWIHRILDEASLYEKNMFLTLTYSEGESLDIELNKKHVQDFIKRLRKYVQPLKIRYFACGEYGTKYRPHYHIIIFGYEFPDLVKFRKDKKGFWMYRSKILEKLWSFGFSSIIPVIARTCEYVTKDMQKLLPLNFDRVPPFVLMSTKPGIGYGAIPEKVPRDGRIWHNGKSVLLPRYYKKVLAYRGFGKEIFELNQQLAVFAENREQNTDPCVESKIYKEKYQKLVDKGKII